MADGQPWSYLEPTLQQALEYVPEEKRKTAAMIAVLGEMGFADMEIARNVELSWRKMNEVRLALQGGLIRVMGEEGHSTAEICRTLRISPGAMASAIGALAPTYG